VIDPRQHRLAREADHRLRVRPGSDAAPRVGDDSCPDRGNLYDEGFVGTWINGRSLVCKDTRHLLTACDLSPSAAAEGCADALNPAGANVNLLIPNTRIDPISGSVPHRSRMCKISRAA
jgi:hypothetical protein